MGADVAWALALLVIFLFFVWRQGIKNRLDLMNLVVLILLDDQEQARQHVAVLEFIGKKRTANKHVLFGRVSRFLTDIANERAKATSDGVRHQLWLYNQKFSN